jgi:hypothetical protein
MSRLMRTWPGARDSPSSGWRPSGQRTTTGSSRTS